MTDMAAPAVDPQDVVAQLVAELTPVVALPHAAVASHCVRHDISMMHLHVLGTLEAGVALPMSRLADVLDVSLSSTTGIVGRLEERGLVERVHDLDDRRLVLVRLTEKGQCVASEMDGVVTRKLTAIVGEMTPEQRSNLLQSLRDLRAAGQRLRERGLLPGTGAAPAVAPGSSQSASEVAVPTLAAPDGVDRSGAPTAVH